MLEPNLVFRTPTNKEAIKKFLAPEVIEEMERQDAELEAKTAETRAAFEEEHKDAIRKSDLEPTN